MKQPAIIIDLDGTLCDTRHRQHYMTGESKNWTAFYEALDGDEPHQWCRELYGRFQSDHQIIFVSGRPSDYRPQTLAWLNERGYDTSYLLMRKSGDFRKDSIIKVELYREHVEPYYDVLFCIDDRQQVVDAWREIGLTCLQCAKGDF